MMTAVIPSIASLADGPIIFLGRGYGLGAGAWEEAHLRAHIMRGIRTASRGHLLSPLAGGGELQKKKVRLICWRYMELKCECQLLRARTPNAGEDIG